MLICVAVTAALAWFATTIGKPILIIDSEAVRTLALIGREAIGLIGSQRTADFDGSRCL